MRRLLLVDSMNVLAKLCFAIGNDAVATFERAIREASQEMRCEDIVLAWDGYAVSDYRRQIWLMYK